MLERTIYLNELIKKNNFKSYLEIGYGEGLNFKNIHCQEKYSVDPEKSKACFQMTSDNYFKNNKRKFDVVFVDGMHLFEYVIRDVVNSLKTLNKGGLIIIHDCLPTQEDRQFRNRITRNWQGDVWKAIVQLASFGYKMELLEIETGIIILKDEKINYNIPEGELDYKWYLEHYTKLFN